MERSYELIEWHNNTNPALNEDNLNEMSQAIYNIDGKLVALSGTLMEDVPRIKEDMEILEPAVASIASNVARAETAAANAETAAGTAEDSADAAAESEANAETAATEAEAAKADIEELLGVPSFWVDLETGDLMYSVDATYNFTVNETTGDLEWEVV